MHVAVLGAGVVGVSSAYYLAMQGCDVTLLERASEPAAGTTHANGGQLAYSFADALAQPSLLPALPGLVLGRDPAMQVKLFGNPSFIRWGLAFLLQCTASRASANTQTILDLARRSSRCLEDLRMATGIDFGFAKSGKLMLLPPGTDMTAVRKSLELKNSQGIRTSMLTLREAIELAPELAGFPLGYSGAVHAPDDEVGDAREFSIRLTRWLQQEKAVECRFDVTVTDVLTESGRVRGVYTDAGVVEADAVLVCLGTHSAGLVRRAGLRLPIFPLRGYSITLPHGTGVPSVSITDVRRRIVFSALHGRVRIAGLADFVGADHSRDTARIAELKRTAMAIAPDYADYGATDMQPWAGDRPMTPDSKPRVGATGIPGLYLNCGHGMLGWTLAAATAQQAATEITQAGP